MAKKKPTLVDAGFVVLKLEKSGLWRFLGETNRQPGLTARAARARAIETLLGEAPSAHDQFAVIPRSEWRVALDHPLP